MAELLNKKEQEQMKIFARELQDSIIKFVNEKNMSLKIFAVAFWMVYQTLTNTMLKMYQDGLKKQKEGN